MHRRTLMIAASASAALLLSACASMQGPADILATASRTPQLSTLNRLLQQSGLDDTLRGSGPYTVFAPSDDAFKAVPAATLAQWSGDKALLQQVLSYHVVPGKVMAADVKNGPAKTVQGANVALSRAGAFVTVEDAVVQTADVQATNGVVHIIDRVLVPPKR